jgi:predicted 2-oxoglutarate/Fe(II)-dependent dioxygenase YbiX
MKKISDYINCFENILDLSICDQIIKDSEKETFESATTLGDVNKNNVRKCYKKFLNKKYDTIIFECVGKVLKKYVKKHPSFNTGASTEDTGYEHLLYKGNQKGEYKFHVDHSDLTPRVLSISFILNDNYEGGNFCFFKKNSFIVKNKKGSAIVFPSNFCFPHAITPVLNGDRHSIVTWIY